MAPALWAAPSITKKLFPGQPEVLGRVNMATRCHINLHMETKIGAQKKSDVLPGSEADSDVAMPK